ncbi:hypothetical protein [Salinispora cortesiana]|uniref:hypothetical protein n=1 Tax=Salinispora cortesiana TaxID=1305843 RepID=UPI000410892C|nr:hypothetical protein [Salinispora cortesiana]
MFGNGRRKTQSQLAKIELGRSFGHLKRAAGHATNGTGATVGPRVRAARSAVAPTALVMRDRAASGYVSTVAALAPLAIAVREAQAEATGRAAAGRRVGADKSTAASKKGQAKKVRATRAKKRSGRGRTAGLLAASAVVGLVGAMALRRRYERREWVEYDPVPSLEPMQAEMDMIEVTTRAPAEQTAPAPTTTGDAAKPAGPATGGASGKAGGGGTATGGASGGAAGSTAKANPGRRSTATPGDKAPATPADKVPATAADKAPATPTEKVPATTEGKSTTGRSTNDLSKAMKNGRH